MSLVNNMLKDLDQRRKSSDSTGAAVDLVPATDPPRSGLSRILIFFMLVLIGVAGGFAYITYEDISLEGISVSRVLDMLPDGVSLPGQGQESATDDEPGAVLRNQVTVRPIEPREDSSATGFTNSLAAPNLVSPSDSTTGPGSALQAPALNTAVAGNSPTGDATTPGTLPSGEGEITLYPEDAMRQIAEAASASQGDGADAAQQASQPAEDAIADAEEAEQAASEVAANQQSPVAGESGVVNLPPSEAVKDYAEMTPEEQDTLAVQYALRLIAANKITEAYASLEQHVMNNRYAHQSRETYAKLLVNEGELLAARNLVESGLQLAPNHAGFKKIKARILIANGAISEAVELLSSRAHRFMKTSNIMRFSPPPNWRVATIRVH